MLLLNTQQLVQCQMFEQSIYIGEDSLILDLPEPDPTLTRTTYIPKKRKYFIKVDSKYKKIPIYICYFPKIK